jgi:hypothetical protein
MKILEDKSGMTAYEAAVYDITDPLVPVRGHGLIELTRLLDTKVLLRMKEVGGCAYLIFTPAKLEMN